MSCSYLFSSLSLEERHHVNTQPEKNTLCLAFVKRLLGKERKKKQYTTKIQVSGVLLLLLYQAQPKSWEEIGHPSTNFKETLFQPPPRAKDAVLCVTTQRHSAHTFPKGKPPGFFPIIKVPTSISRSRLSGQGFQKPPVTETHNVEPAEMVKHVL